MSRPKPIVISKIVEKDTHKVEEILESTGIYAVFYEGKPINIRTSNDLVDYPGPKYKKVAFPNPGHAFNLAEKMNKKYVTDKFQVYCLTSGIVVLEAV
jgi:hypothetical protein